MLNQFEFIGRWVVRFNNQLEFLSRLGCACKKAIFWVYGYIPLNRSGKTVFSQMAEPLNRIVNHHQPIEIEL